MLASEHKYRTLLQSNVSCEKNPTENEHLHFRSLVPYERCVVRNSMHFQLCTKTKAKASGGSSGTRRMPPMPTMRVLIPLPEKYHLPLYPDNTKWLPDS